MSSRQNKTEKILWIGVGCLVVLPLAWWIGSYYISGSADVKAIKQTIASVELPAGVVLVKETCSKGDIFESPYGSCQYIYSFEGEKDSITSTMKASFQSAGIEANDKTSSSSTPGFTFNDSNGVEGMFGFNMLNQILLTVRSEG